MVEGNAAAANADALVFNIMAAFYTACTSFMGQNWGAGKRERALKSYFISLTYSFAAGLVLGGLFLLFGEGFLSLFANDAAVIDAGMQRLRIMGFPMQVSAVYGCVPSLPPAGIGKSFAPTVIVILGSAFSASCGFTRFSRILKPYRRCICCISFPGLLPPLWKLPILR